MAMNEIKTKIVLRNDESEAWADSSLILDKISDWQISFCIGIVQPIHFPIYQAMAYIF